MSRRSHLCVICGIAAAKQCLKCKDEYTCLNHYGSFVCRKPTQQVASVFQYFDDLSNELSVRKKPRLRNETQIPGIQTEHQQNARVDSSESVNTLPTLHSQPEISNTVNVTDRYIADEAVAPLSTLLPLLPVVTSIVTLDSNTSTSTSNSDFDQHRDDQSGKTARGIAENVITSKSPSIKPSESLVDPIIYNDLMRNLLDDNVTVLEDASDTQSKVDETDDRDSGSDSMADNRHGCHENNNCNSLSDNCNQNDDDDCHYHHHVSDFDNSASDGHSHGVSLNPNRPSAGDSSPSHGIAPASMTVTVDSEAIIAFDKLKLILAVQHIGISKKIEAEFGSFFVTCLSTSHDILLCSGFKGKDSRLLIGVGVFRADAALNIKSEPFFIFTTNDKYLKPKSFSSIGVTTDDFTIDQSIPAVFETLNHIQIIDSVPNAWTDISSKEIDYSILNHAIVQDSIAQKIKDFHSAIVEDLIDDLFENQIPVAPKRVEVPLRRSTRTELLRNITSHCKALVGDSDDDSSNGPELDRNDLRTGSNLQAVTVDSHGGRGGGVSGGRGGRGRDSSGRGSRGSSRGSRSSRGGDHSGSGRGGRGASGRNSGRASGHSGLNRGQGGTPRDVNMNDASSTRQDDRGLLLSDGSDAPARGLGSISSSVGSSKVQVVPSASKTQCLNHTRSDSLSQGTSFSEFIDFYDKDNMVKTRIADQISNDVKRQYSAEAEERELSYSKKEDQRKKAHLSSLAELNEQLELTKLRKQLAVEQFSLESEQDSHKRERELQSLRHNSMVASGGQTSFTSPGPQHNSIQIAVPVTTATRSAQTPASTVPSLPSSEPSAISISSPSLPDHKKAWAVFCDLNSWNDPDDQKFYFDNEGLVNDVVLGGLEASDIEEIGRYLKRLPRKAWLASFGLRLAD